MGASSPSTGSGANPPQLTVVLTAFDRRLYLREALRSIAAQGMGPAELEVLLLANFEDPETDALLRGLGGRWVRRTDTPLGAWVADGIRMARGDVVVLMDDDDLFAPGRLAAILSTFSKEPELGFYRNATRTFVRPEEALGHGEAGKMKPPTAVPLRLSGRQRSSKAFFAAWSLGGGYNASSMAVRPARLGTLPDELASAPTAAAPFLFYLAWVRGVHIEIDPVVRTWVRVHPGQDSFLFRPPGPERLGQLEHMAPELVRTCDLIVRFVEGSGTRAPLRPVLQLRATLRILQACREAQAPRRQVFCDLLHLLRHPKSSTAGMTRKVVLLGLARLVSPSWGLRRLRRELGEGPNGAPARIP